MIQNDKGVYPTWVNDAEIINQVLKEIISAGGRLPFSYVVNPYHSAESQTRMKSIILFMQKEKLILADADWLEIDIEGNRAVHLGYKKYRKIKKWDSIHKLSQSSLMVFALLIMGLIGLLVYFVLHRMKVV